MKTRAIFALTAAAALAGTAFAAPTVRLSDTGGNGNNNDGFWADLGADGSDDFVTFCVETQEFFKYGRAYEYTISTYVTNRAGAGPLSLDNPTGYAIAHIFETFSRDGGSGIAGLSGIGGLSSTQYRELVQRTIWNKLYGGNTTGTFTQGKIDQLFAAALGQTNSLGRVRVMNLWEDAETGLGPAQDQLILIPLPSGAGLAAAGLLGLAAAGRRRQA